METRREPVIRGGVHHIDLTVKNAEASFAFYESVLGFMGYKLQEQTEFGFDFDLTTPGAPFTSIGIRDARGPNASRAHDRYTIGLHHIAWAAQSRADVDAMHAHLIKIGAQILFPPSDYPEYGPTYYAVFFSDPDGLKLEFVYRP
jgi:catechol 2,3-dioxygenase-like lactoylglutathione lyase family enzyme